MTLGANIPSLSAAYWTATTRVLNDVYCFVIVKSFLYTVLAEGLVYAVQLHVINTHLGKDLC